jgi:hypothetical protein
MHSVVSSTPQQYLSPEMSPNEKETDRFLPVEKIEPRVLQPVTSHFIDGVLHGKFTNSA